MDTFDIWKKRFKFAIRQFERSPSMGSQSEWSRLRGTNLRKANLFRTNITGALHDKETKWPEGFDPKKIRSD